MRVVGVLRFMVDNMSAPNVMRVALLTEPVEGAAWAHAHALPF